jgi:hypothetical protein
VYVCTPPLPLRPHFTSIKVAELLLQPFLPSHPPAPITLELWSSNLRWADYPVFENMSSCWCIGVSWQEIPNITDRGWKPLEYVMEVRVLRSNTSRGLLYYSNLDLFYASTTVTMCATWNIMTYGQLTRGSQKRGGGVRIARWYSFNLFAKMRTANCTVCIHSTRQFQKPAFVGDYETIWGLNCPPP